MRGETGMSGKLKWALLASVSFLAWSGTTISLFAQQEKVRMGDKTLLAWVQFPRQERVHGDSFPPKPTRGGRSEWPEAHT